MFDRRRALAGALLVAAVTALGAGCNDVRATKTAKLSLDPEEFRFPKLQPGQSLVREVEVRNLGRGELLLRNLHLEDHSTAHELTLLVKDDSGQYVPPPAEARLPGNSDEALVLAVRYSPSDDVATADTGAVLVETNDSEQEHVSIPVGSGDIGAKILVSPRTLDFGPVEAGQTGVQHLTITNVGQVDLVISRLQVSGSMDFGARYQDRDLVGDLGADPLVVARGQSLSVDATYAPPALGPDTGELQIFSNDAQEPTVAVNLRANGAAPCIRVLPESLDFGSALIVDDPNGDTPNKRTLVVESCGTTPLRVDAAMVDSADGAFKLTADFEPFELPAVDPESPTPPSHEIEVGFWPTEEHAYGARLLLTSNGTDEPLPVDLFGRGVENACPIPAVTEESYHVQPLDVVTLDGTPSMDPGGQVERYEWTVVDRPDGSTGDPVESFADARHPRDGGMPDDTTTPQALFFVDLAGHYEIDLKVYDNLGQVSCEPKAVARVSIDAVPEKDLHVQLVWSTPDDPDETDMSGTDVDLHVRHQNAGDVWDDPVWDCYYRNAQPEWGVSGDLVDNPTLDIDDTNGAGPENINLSKPEVGVTYDVAALYYRSTSTFGSPDNDPRVEHESLVSVRVYVRGELLAEWVDQALDHEKDLWWVASLRWCEDPARCPEVVPRGDVLPDGSYRVP